MVKSKCKWTWIDFGSFWATECQEVHEEEPPGKCPYCKKEVEIDND